MNEIIFTYQRNKDDVLAHSVWHRMIKSKFNLGMNFFFPAVGILTVVMSMNYEVTTFQYIAMAYLISYPITVYMFIKLRINATFKDPNIVFDTTTFTINSYGINTQSEKGEFLLAWDQLFSAYETKKYIYLYVDKTRSLMIKKDFIGNEKVIALREIIKRNAATNIIKLKKERI